MRLGTSFKTRLAADAAFTYLADFGSIEEWDPFIRVATRLDPGPPRIGSRYHLEGRFLGRRVDLDYRLTELEPPRRLKLIGSGGRAYDGWDEITVTPSEGGGATVRYEAEVQLHGPARLLWVAAPIALMLGGGRALKGMRRRLDALAAAS